MSVKLDRFTWIVIIVVVALLAAAVITASVTRGRGVEQAAYLESDTPEAPVYNAFVALQKGDLFTARAQYSQRVLQDIADQDYDPFAGRGTDSTPRRLRILKVEADPTNPDRALVSYVQDNYGSGGLFGGGNTWSNSGVATVVREDGQWKLDTQDFFY